MNIRSDSLRKPIKYLLLIFATISSSVVYAARDGGGGAGIICPADSDQPRIQMLDFFEGKHRYNLTINESSDDHVWQLDEMIMRMRDVNPFLYQDLKAARDHILSNRDFLPSGIVLDESSDVTFGEPVLKPTNCDLTGVGFYKDEKLLIATDYFNLMNETQKAIFYLHEITYKVYRDFSGSFVNNITAQEARELTARLAAVDNLQISHIENSFTWLAYNLFNTRLKANIKYIEVDGIPSVTKLKISEIKDAPVKCDRKKGKVTVNKNPGVTYIVYCLKSGQFMEETEHGNIGNGRYKVGGQFFTSGKNGAELTLEDDCKAVGLELFSVSSHVSVDWELGGCSEENWKIDVYANEQLVSEQTYYTATESIFPIYLKIR